MESSSIASINAICNQAGLHAKSQRCRTQIKHGEKWQQPLKLPDMGTVACHDPAFYFQMTTGLWERLRLQIKADCKYSVFCFCVCLFLFSFSSVTACFLPSSISSVHSIPQSEGERERKRDRAEKGEREGERKTEQKQKEGERERGPFLCFGPQWLYMALYWPVNVEPICCIFL